MNYHRLREIVGQADSAAILERAAQCYNLELAKGLRDTPLPFDEKEIPVLAWSAAWFKNRYGFYTPSVTEKIKYYFVARRAIKSARLRHANENLDFMQINNYTCDLKADIIGRSIGKVLRRNLPKKVIGGLKAGMKKAIRNN